MRLIPLPWVAAILLQTAGLVWWGAVLHSRVEAVETKTRAQDNTGERLAKIETQNTFILDMVKELRGDIKGLVDTSRK
jgi:hypothetical protein